MFRFTKCFALCLVILCMAVIAVDAQQTVPTKSAQTGYALAIFFGFGSGQYYLGANGTPFLIGDIVGFTGMASGLVYMLAYSSDPDPWVVFITGSYIMIAGGLVYFVTRVWEIVDIFGTAERMRQAGKVVRIVPDISVQTTHISLRLNVRY